MCASPEKLAQSLRRITFGTLVLAALPFPVALSQDSGEDPAVPIRIEARAIDKRFPHYPLRAAREGREGWVILSVVVSESGDVIEPMIEDSSGNEDFEREALQTVRKWKYEPATVNGAPVEQALTQVKMIFAIDDGSEGASRAFARAYDGIAANIAAGELESAREMLIDLQDSEKLNLYEDSWFWWSKFVYLDASGSEDELEKRDALQKAVGYQEAYLTPDTLLTALQHLYVLQVETGDAGAALETFDKLIGSEDVRQAENYAAVADMLEQHAAFIRELVAGPELLSSPGEIGRFDYWVHVLLRRSFAIVDVEGSLERVDVRCENGTRRFDWVSDDDQWTVPDSWAECGLYLKGEPGTTFTLYEYPPE